MKLEQIEQDQHDILTSKSVAVTLGADFDLTAQFTEGCARRLYVGTGGTVVAKKLNDAAASQSYLNVPSGSYLDGLWVTVLSTAHGTTASNIVAER